MALKTYLLRVDETLFYRFQKVAEANHRTVIKQIEFLMDEAVKEFEKSKKNMDD